MLRKATLSVRHWTTPRAARFQTPLPLEGACTGGNKLRDESAHHSRRSRRGQISASVARRMRETSPRSEPVIILQGEGNIEDPSNRDTGRGRRRGSRRKPMRRICQKARCPTAWRSAPAAIADRNLSAPRRIRSRQDHDGSGRGTAGGERPREAAARPQATAIPAEEAFSR